MKITLCVYDLLNNVGGAERSLIDLANHLSDRQFAITILNFQKPGRYTGENFYPIHDRVALKVFSPQEKNNELESVRNTSNICNPDPKIQSWLAENETGY